MKLSGNSLIEVIIALAIFLVGTVAVTNLVFSNLNVVDRDTDETRRMFFAREAIELARDTRDSNWLSGNAFSAGLSIGNDRSGVPNWNPGTDAAWDFTASTLNDSSAQIIQVNGGSSDGAYANLVGSLTGSSTAYRRLVILHPICDDGSIKNDNDTCAATQVGIRVESIVTSTRKSVTRTTTLFADFYDWK